MDPIHQNIEGVRQLVSSKTNKINSGGLNASEGVESEFKEELDVDLTDEELLNLAKQWESDYRSYEQKIKVRQQANKIYYLGKQLEGSAESPAIAANLIFEAEETFLPVALSKNPEPVVWSDNSEEGNKLSKNVKTMLQYHADILVLRRKLTLMTRHWSIYFIGVIKHGWNKEISDITSEVRRPDNFILDSDGYVDCYGDFIGYIGERITVSASELCELFPKHEAYITVMVSGKMGTKVVYTEWWQDKFCFYTFKDKVLDKHKNQYFNYDKESVETDEDGVENKVENKGKNHFAKPKKPYTFLAVYSLGDQPHDITGLIEQNIPNQNRITKRESQIDTNLDRANNSIALSDKGFTQETAKQAAKALEKGHPILVSGPINESIARFDAPSVPDAFFKAAETDKQNLRSIFGTEGISSQKPNDNTTARGMILNQQFDNSRIGGGIGDALEQVADNVFNWWVQLYHVFYDEPHLATIMGQLKAVEYVTLSNQDFGRQLVVSVQPDSMKPKDEITQMNQALELWGEGALDPQTLLTMLDFPNPKETAAQMWLWKTNPQAYGQLNFPDLQAQLQQLMAQGQPVQGGGQAPPEGQVPESQPETLSANPASPSLEQVGLPKI